jgi:Multicopper oxidase
MWGQIIKVIPGHFKMRSRFVDYPGVYVMHCHILVHEDRGMMFTVEVNPLRPLSVHNHWRSASKLRPARAPDGRRRAIRFPRERSSSVDVRI